LNTASGEQALARRASMATIQRRMGFSGGGADAVR
jgi:hypothetical protein